MTRGLVSQSRGPASVPRQVAPLILQTPGPHVLFMHFCALHSAEVQMRALSRTNREGNTTFRDRNPEMPGRLGGSAVGCLPWAQDLIPGSLIESHIGLPAGHLLLPLPVSRQESTIFISHLRFEKFELVFLSTLAKVRPASKHGIAGSLDGSAVGCLPWAWGVTPESWDRVPHQAPLREPASPSTCVSASLCL